MLSYILFSHGLACPHIASGLHSLKTSGLMWIALLLSWFAYLALECGPYPILPKLTTGNQWRSADMHASNPASIPRISLLQLLDQHATLTSHRSDNGAAVSAGDNLMLPVVGSIMRTCGAFFIRRTVKGCPDAALYKAVLSAYLRALIFRGISLEFFIEGGRSRDGRIAAPKLGLISTCVDASLSSSCQERPVYIVPVTISYDLPLEEKGMLRELMGMPKQQETTLQFVCAFAKVAYALVWRACTPWRQSRQLGLGGHKGRVAVSFGEPLSVQHFLKERARRRRKRSARKGFSDLCTAAAGALLCMHVAEQQTRRCGSL
jgi:1-acyl-sn-glycerol-3-phosphate acyltransferase